MHAYAVTLCNAQLPSSYPRESLTGERDRITLPFLHSSSPLLPSTLLSFTVSL